MDVINPKAKKGLITKTWERCRSIGGGGGGGSGALMMKSRSWPRSGSGGGGGAAVEDEEKRPRKHRVAPEGCFSVYVGPQKQRFVVKTEYANHPLFKMLLEEAELEYGFNSDGPLALPCNVDRFYKVLVEMEDSYENRGGCTGFGSYRLLSPSRSVAMNKL